MGVGWPFGKVRGACREHALGWSHQHPGQGWVNKLPAPPVHVTGYVPCTVAPAVLQGIPRCQGASRSGWGALTGRPGSAIWAHSQVCSFIPSCIQQTLSAYCVQGTGQRAVNNDRGLELRDFKYSGGDNFKRANRLRAKGSGCELT